MSRSNSEIATRKTSLAISETDFLQVPTICNTYVSGLCKGISLENMTWSMVPTYLHLLDPEIPILLISYPLPPLGVKSMTSQPKQLPGEAKYIYKPATDGVLALAKDMGNHHQKYGCTPSHHGFQYSKWPINCGWLVALGLASHTKQGNNMLLYLNAF